MCKVSVIVPVYNAEKTLRKCVESIVFGICREVEVILVEDHSADESWELCRELEQQFDNVRALRNDRNRGVSHTRNRGLDAAMGEYVLFCDSDDWVTANYVQDLMICASANPHTLVCCGYTKYYTNSRKEVVYSTNKQDVVEKEAWFSLMDKELIHYVWNKCFNRHVIQRVGLKFDENQYMGEDFQFVLDYLSVLGCQTVLMLNDPMYFYSQINPDSLVHRWSRTENLEQAISRIRQLAAMAGDEGMGEQKVRELKENFVYLISRDKTRTRDERVQDIAFVMCDGRAVHHYRRQRWNYFKEKIAAIYEKIGAVCKRENQ